LLLSSGLENAKPCGSPDFFTLVTPDLPLSSSNAAVKLGGGVHKALRILIGIGDVPSQKMNAQSAIDEAV